MDTLLFLLNPYTNQQFFGFFITLAKRVGSLFGTERGFLAADELQLLTLILIAFSCTLVGAFLVQARKTMVANALSHTILLGIVVAFLLERTFFSGHDLSDGLSQPQLVLAAFISALLTTFFTEYLTKKMDVQEDASIGLVFTLFFAIGVILLTLFARNVHLGTELVMGSVDSLHAKDLLSAGKIFVLNGLFYLLFFKECTISIFDPSLASLQGLRPQLFRYLLLFQTALVAMTAFQAVGVVMVLAFFVAPSLIVRPFVKRLSTLIYASLAVSGVACLVSVALSRHILTQYGVGLATGGIVVLLLFVFYLLVNGIRLTYTRPEYQ